MPHLEAKMSKENIIENLRQLVTEWLQATGGDLNGAKAGVEMLMSDVATVLDIEKSQIGL
jgi:hypothetical protein